MSKVDVDAVLAGLKPFQRNAVAHVQRLFYGEDSNQHGGRFLIADETGLGKSLIAKGIIAETVRALEQDDTVKRINIIYICSNRDLAQQNLKRLNITGQKETAVATRLSLLATESSRLQRGHGTGHTKPINLVSFTPGTSFSSTKNWRGNAEERSLLVLLLDKFLNHNETQKRATRAIFRAPVRSMDRFTGYVSDLAKKLGTHIDPEIVAGFEKRLRDSQTLQDFVSLRDLMTDDQVPEDRHLDISCVIKNMRGMLSQASAQSIEPNLVIMDEFQRFKTLLDPESGDEAAELADELFSYEDAKVLLLSATPYKPFTQADSDDENHYEDFLATLEFLCNRDKSRVKEIQESLDCYRKSLISGGDSKTAAKKVSSLLTRIMTRSERPQVISERDQVAVKRLEVPIPEVSDLTEWVHLSKLGKMVKSPVSIEYWKSIPHFGNFFHTYHLETRLNQGLSEPGQREVRRLLNKSWGITQNQIENRAAIDPGNGRLRALFRETLDRGWWKLLWMPPSMPYTKPGPVYSSFSDRSVTKHVIFSAWTATPTSIATIMSHEADRRMRGLGEKGLGENGLEHTSQRLVYGQHEETALNVSTLALFWPHPTLCHMYDQLAAVREAGEPLSADEILEQVKARLPEGPKSEQPWQAYFAHRGSFDPEQTDERFALSRNAEGAIGLKANITQAHKFSDAHSTDNLTHPDLAGLIAFSPANIAYRALMTVAGKTTTSRGIWRAAFLLADALRTLFNRPDAQALLDHLDPNPEDKTPYWKRVLSYCADGNLRAVLDEYLFQLWCETSQKETTDEDLLAFAETVAEVLGIRPTHYSANEVSAERPAFKIPVRFAVRYGGTEGTRSESDSGVARQSVVRSAFNSPFAPFILASTSVGQEGIDFHWWCHSVVHWNLPSNPVDFEQREGRVNRYGGLAVRKNVAEQHWKDVLASANPSAWRAAFDAASETESEAGHFSPWWVYPGTTQVQRVLMQYPLSKDIEKYDQLRSSLTLYRLTLGQPRQEDMVEMLQRNKVDGLTVATIDLSPPSSNGY